jgi:rhodanese-related sulfurtransferase
VSRFDSVEQLLADARSRLERVTAERAAELLAAGWKLVDIRPAWQRDAGEVPGSVVVERNHLEWRLHPASEARIAAAVNGQRWIVMCVDGYTSSLAADALNSIGVPATDIDGGFTAWQAAGLPTVRTITAPDCVVS